jgi:hypothetical protein
MRQCASGTLCASLVCPSCLTCVSQLPHLCVPAGQCDSQLGLGGEQPTAQASNDSRQKQAQQQQQQRLGVCSCWHVWHLVPFEGVRGSEGAEKGAYGGKVSVPPWDGCHMCGVSFCKGLQSSVLTDVWVCGILAPCPCMQLAWALHALRASLAQGPCTSSVALLMQRLFMGLACLAHGPCTWALHPAEESCGGHAHLALGCCGA